MKNQNNKSCSVTVVAEQSCCHAIRDARVASCDTAISIQVWRYQIRRAPVDAAVDLDRRWRCAGGAASRAISRRRQASSQREDRSIRRLLDESTTSTYRCVALAPPLALSFVSCCMGLGTMRRMCERNVLCIDVQAASRATND